MGVFCMFFVYNICWSLSKNCCIFLWLIKLKLAHPKYDICHQHLKLQKLQDYELLLLVLCVRWLQGPHDHFLRASKEAGKIVCPKLLATECKFCGKMGHTARFCGEKVDREFQRRAEFNAKKQKALDAGDWMDVGEVQREHPGFQSPRISRAKPTCPGAPKASRIVSRFAALEMESESSGDECPESPAEVVEPTGTSWAAS